MPSDTAERATKVNVFKALAHPLRMKLLAVLSEREASPTELATEFDEPLGNVAYHMKILENLDCVELVRTTPRRGALEHYYRASVRAFLTEEQWSCLPAASRRAISADRLSEVWADAAAAIKAGTFDSRTNRHLSWTNVVVDEQGWRDLSALLAETLERVLELQAEVAARLEGKASDASLNAKVVLMQYEAAPPASKARSGRQPKPRRRTRRG